MICKETFSKQLDKKKGEDRWKKLSQEAKEEGEMKRAKDLAEAQQHAEKIKREEEEKLERRLQELKWTCEGCFRSNTPTELLTNAQYLCRHCHKWRSENGKEKKLPDWHESWARAERDNEAVREDALLLD